MRVIRIILILTYLSFVGLIISLGVVISNLIMRESVVSIPHQLPFPFFASAFIGLIILAVAEDSKQLINNI